MGVLRDAMGSDGDRHASARLGETPGGTSPMGLADEAPAAASSPAAAAAAAPAAAVPAAAAAAGPVDRRGSEPDAGPPPGASSELRRRRDVLAEQVTEMHWDLGGLAYEMAIRDHFRLDVLVRRAAMLQERDAELAEVERLLRMEEDGVAGTCPSCAAPHSRGAIYCWQCGTALMERRASTQGGVEEATVMEALLPPPRDPAAEQDS